MTRSQDFAGEHSLVWALMSIPYGIFGGSSSFGIYDTLPNNLSMVAVYAMRSIDYPTNVDANFSGAAAAVPTPPKASLSASQGPNPVSCSFDESFVCS